MKKKFLYIIAVLIVSCGLCSCGTNKTVQTEATTAEVQEQATAKEITAEITEEITETSAEATSEPETETVIIAGQEYQIDATSAEIILTNDSPLVTDISEIGKLKNLRSLTINNLSDGGPYVVAGLNTLEGCETITEVYIMSGLADASDIHVLETFPNLKTLIVYGINAYDDFSFDLPSIERLYTVGTFDLSRIEHLTELKELSLEYNTSTDLSPIAKLTSLEGLSITECDFTDYSDILELENLDGLFISSAPMTKEMYNKIAEKFPDCNITIINDFID